eukprot:30802-Pelagococcus_subviridis.AAC.12
MHLERQRRALQAHRVRVRELAHELPRAGALPAESRLHQPGVLRLGKDHHDVRGERHRAHHALDNIHRLFQRPGDFHLRERALLHGRRVRVLFARRRRQRLDRVLRLAARRVDRVDDVQRAAKLRGVVHALHGDRGGELQRRLHARQGELHVPRHVRARRRRRLGARAEMKGADGDDRRVFARVRRHPLRVHGERGRRALARVRRGRRDGQRGVHVEDKRGRGRGRERRGGGFRVYPRRRLQLDGPRLPAAVGGAPPGHSHEHAVDDDRVREPQVLDLALDDHEYRRVRVRVVARAASARDAHRRLHRRDGDPGLLLVERDRRGPFRGVSAWVVVRRVRDDLDAVQRVLEVHVDGDFSILKRRRGRVARRQQRRSLGRVRVRRDARGVDVAHERADRRGAVDHRHPRVAGLDRDRSGEFERPVHCGLAFGSVRARRPRRDSPGGFDREPRHRAFEVNLHVVNLQR